jgi:hypothetical protein
MVHGSRRSLVAISRAQDMTEVYGHEETADLKTGASSKVFVTIKDRHTQDA